MNNGMFEHYDPALEMRKRAAASGIDSVKAFAVEQATDPLNYAPFGATTKAGKWAVKGLLGAAMGQKATEADATIFSLAKAPKHLLDEALDMQAKGQSEAAIFKKTGIDFKSQKYYVPDVKAKLVSDAFHLTKRPEPLSRYFANEPVMALMPELRRLRISVDPNLGKGTNAAFRPKDDMVLIAPHMLSDPKKLLSSIVHEVQHKAQKVEGKPFGANPEKIFDLMLQKRNTTIDKLPVSEEKQLRNTAHQIYRQNPGEKEARFSQKLMRTDLQSVPESHYSSIDDLMNQETIYNQTNISPFYSDLFK